MQKHILAALLLSLLTAPVRSQRLFTRDAVVEFFSETPVEKIEAKNTGGSCVLDTQTGKMEWKVLIKGFKFHKALMEEHFNENYLESSKFPSATFKGEITNLSAVNFGKDGQYPVKVKGKMTIHGVEKEVWVDGVLKVNGATTEVLASLKVLCADYNISIPSVVAGNIAKEILVKISATLAVLK
jgi:polyisoprenoid-binding protein YceI